MKKELCESKRVFIVRTAEMKVTFEKSKLAGVFGNREAAEDFAASLETDNFPIIDEFVVNSLSHYKPNN